MKRAAQLNYRPTLLTTAVFRLLFIATPTKAVLLLQLVTDRSAYIIMISSLRAIHLVNSILCLDIATRKINTNRIRPACTTVIHGLCCSSPSIQDNSVEDLIQTIACN